MVANLLVSPQALLSLAEGATAWTDRRGHCGCRAVRMNRIKRSPQHAARAALSGNTH